MTRTNLNRFGTLIAFVLLCVGFSIMVLVTVAGNLHIRSLPRDARMMIAVILGSILGTVITSTLKGRNLLGMLQHASEGADVLIETCSFKGNVSS